MKVGFAGRFNPLDRTAWSGTYSHTYEAIRNYYEVETFYYTWPRLVRERLLLHKFWQKLHGKKAAVEFLNGYARYFSKELERELRTRRVDLLFVPSAPQLFAFCNTDIPIIYMNDATFFQLQGYYPSFQGIAEYNIRQGIAMDKRACEKAAHYMPCSEWARQSAISDYHIPAGKITVAPPGPNMEKIPSASELTYQLAPVCRLLFLGVEWERKGGAIALDTFFLLQQKGIPVQLTIIGCIPPVPITDKNITVIPFLDKNKAADAQRLYEIFLETSFLLVPTRAECSGVVFCEASAFGVPSITTDTGGVSTNVVDGINGYALPLEAGAAAYADRIAMLFEDKNAYEQICRTSREQFENLFNWDHWGKTFHRIAQTILN